jgi:hypothetical protein
MVAIITALHSPSIQRLTMTRKEVADKAKGLMALFLDMEQLLRQDQGYRRYRDALKQSNASCIPWISKHLLPISAVVLRYQCFRRPSCRAEKRLTRRSWRRWTASDQFCTVHGVQCSDEGASGLQVS